jgi:hypothetical protein
LYENATTQNDSYIPPRDVTGSQPEPFPTLFFLAASEAIVAVVGFGLLVWFKKRKR